MIDRIAETYVARSTGMRRGLYDTYKMAIRWASDRIGEQGVVAFVTNGSWIDGNVDSGVRACLAEEFSTVYVMNLRGNARTSGERRRAEGDNVFGQGSRAPVAVTVLVRNPDSMHDGCRILYRDVGDYLTREDKLARLREWGSVAGVSDWQEITPDRHNDWIGQRDEAFQAFYPLGSKQAKAGKSDDAIFRLFSSGYKTGRDAYVYSFSREACVENVRNMVDDYTHALEVRDKHPTYAVNDAARRFSSNTKWDQGLLNRLARQQRIPFRPSNVWFVQYRPFVKLYGYVDSRVSWSKYQQDSIFPPPDDAGTVIAHTHNRPLGDQPSNLRTGSRVSQAVLDDHGRQHAGSGTGVEGTVLPALPVRAANRVICAPGRGATKPFSVLIADHMPDLHFLEFGQCFPRWVYAAYRGHL